LGERRVRSEAEAEPQIMIGVHKPAFPSRDDAVLNVISSILAAGRSSVMYKDLVKQKQVTTDINTSSSYPGARFDNLFVIMGSPRHPNTNEQLEKEILGHLDSLKNKPVDM
jgi:predicted Zn-dependent peptidase